MNLSLTKPVKVRVRIAVGDVEVPLVTEVGVTYFGADSYGWGFEDWIYELRHVAPNAYWALTQELEKRSLVYFKDRYQKGGEHGRGPDDQGGPASRG